MNDSEYRDWFKAHASAFPGIVDWLKRQGSDGAADISKAWKDCLSDVSRDDALAATRAMNLGDESAPAGFGDHARAVRKVANKMFFDRRDEKKSQGRTIIDGKETFNCKWCRDSGWVEVVNIWRKKTRIFETRPLRRFWDELTNYLPTCAVPCTCAAYQVSRDRPRDRFNPETMFIVDLDSRTEDEAERFRQWWSDGRHIGNRVAAFDEWNQTT